MNSQKVLVGYLFSFFFLQVHFLYQFSLQFFLDIFQCVLYENPKLKSMKDPQQRLKVLCSDLFQVNITSPLIYYEWPFPPSPPPPPQREETRRFFLPSWVGYWRPLGSFTSV